MTNTVILHREGVVPYSDKRFYRMLESFRELMPITAKKQAGVSYCNMRLHSVNTILKSDWFEDGMTYQRIPHNFLCRLIYRGLYLSIKNNSWLRIDMYKTIRYEQGTMFNEEYIYDTLDEFAEKGLIEIAYCGNVNEFVYIRLRPHGVVRCRLDKNGFFRDFVPNPDNDNIVTIAKDLTLPEKRDHLSLKVARFIKDNLMEFS